MAQLDWVSDAARRLNADSALKKLGSTDLVLGLKAGGIAWIVVFQAFAIARAEQADDAQPRDCEVVVEMQPRQWTSYLRQRAAGRGLSLVAADVERGIVRAKDPLARLKFERYHLSIQALVDRGATVAERRRRG